MAYRGDYAASNRVAYRLIEETRDATLRLRTGLFRVNTRIERAAYGEALKRMSDLLSLLPAVTEPGARAQALTATAYLYEQAGQYELASSCAQEHLDSGHVLDDFACKAGYANLAALYKGGNLQGIEQKLRDGITACFQVGNSLYANGIRYYIANLALQRDNPKQAIKLMLSHYGEVRRSGYMWLIAKYDALLARAYLQVKNLPEVRKSALAVTVNAGKSQHAKSLSAAYQVLYLMDKAAGNLAGAFENHEKYMTANEGYLDTVSSRAIAFQVVQQEVMVNKMQIDSLSKRNEILQLQQLDRSAAQTSRLYLLLLLAVLASIAFWA